MRLFADLETRSKVGLKTHGTHRYAEDAEIILFPYAIDDGPVQIWDCLHDETMPDDLMMALYDPDCEVVFHRAAFDRVILRHTLIDLPIERVHCTMVQALSHGMPGDLDTLGRVLGLPADKQKIKEGKKLITLFCEKQADPSDYPEHWERFKQYAINDVEAMRIVYSKLPHHNYRGAERKLWELDQKINDRGIYVDLELARTAAKAGEKAKEDINERLIELTEGRVSAVTQRDRIVNELDGIDLLDKDTVKKALRTETDPVQKEILELRQQGGRISTAKYAKLPRMVNSDGRIRGLIEFCGAIRTGRWSSKAIQWHNLPRPEMDADEIDIGIQALKEGTANLLFDNIIGLCADALRGVVIAPPGKKLVAADWSSIEVRVLSWLAGETWKMQAFVDYDNGVGPDVYKLLYSKSLNRDLEDVTGDERQQGKGMELSMQYEGGVSAIMGIGATYGLDIELLAEEAPKRVPKNILQKANEMWNWAVKKDMTHGLPKEQYVACEAIKRVWRLTNPATVNYWRAIENAAKKAILDPGQAYRVRHCVFQCVNKTLTIKLPSGRKLIYPLARIDSDGITFMKAPGWYRANLYGGFLAENITQAVARDVLAAALPILEDEGFEVILHVHDEVIAEVEEDSVLDVDRMCRVMEQPLPWARDLPLVADGFEAYRYRKG